MKKQFDQMREFSEAFNAMYLHKPTFDIPVEHKKFRIKLMQSEMDEVTKAMLEEDIYAVAHELGDLMYTLLGTAVAFGLQDKFEEIFTEIHRSNMSKLGSDSKPILDKDGKAIKSENYKKADMRNILDKEI